jgi:sporulation protein YlmC with PRC-barrel domain
MLNKFLATTALSAMLALPAYAQTADTAEEPMDAPAVEEGMDAPEGDDPMADDPLADDALDEDPLAEEEFDTDMTEEPDMPEAGIELTAEEVIGADVLSFEGESIANVDDVVLTAEGDVEYILVDVGGFLGLGARTVAIPFADVTVQMDDSGNPELQTQLSEDDLENMPEYEEG